MGFDFSMKPLTQDRLEAATACGFRLTLVFDSDDPESRRVHRRWKDERRARTVVLRPEAVTPADFRSSMTWARTSTFRSRAASNASKNFMRQG